MALLGCESFDLINDVEQVDDFWTQNLDTDTIVVGGGRCSSNAYEFSSIVGTVISVGVNPTGDVGYAGMAVCPGGASMFSPITIMRVLDATGSTMPIVHIYPDGSVKVFRSETVTDVLLATSAAGLIALDHWYHIGFEWSLSTLDDASAYVKLWVNGVLVAQSSGTHTVSTFPFGGLTVGPWSAIGFGGRYQVKIDDLYWGDGSGAAPWNAFLGDLRVEGQLAQTDAAGGGGTYQEFTPNTGTDHGALVDDASPDDDTTFVSSDTVNTRETFQFPAITLTAGTVYGIQLMANVMKTHSGARTMACMVRQGGTDTLGADQGISQTTYEYLWEIFQTNPTTAAAWNASSANDMEGGIKVTS